MPEPGSVSRLPLRPVLREAEQVLAAAGVSSPRVDVELLAAHVLGVSRTRLLLVGSVEVEAVDRFRQLVARRAERVPLQHLVGTAPLGEIDLLVGPGVFVPRPETELLLSWGVELLAGVSSPLVVDLCTGSGALALALAHARPDARVYAVERDGEALAWARRNVEARAAAGDTPIRLLAGDVADPELLAELVGQVDLVLCNPPYVPEGTPVPPEVGEHDPHQAVFAGPDGLEVIRHVVTCAARLLRPGGGVAIEHDDSHGTAVPELLARHGGFVDVTGHRDLAGRPRFATARRAPRS